MMAWVWPPQISMMFHGRVTAARMAAASRLTPSALRYSSRYFMKGMTNVEIRMTKE